MWPRGVTERWCRATLPCDGAERCRISQLAERICRAPLPHVATIEDAALHAAPSDDLVFYIAGLIGAV